MDPAGKVMICKEGVGDSLPTSEADLNLMHRIFGEASRDIKDPTLAVPPHMEGIVLSKPLEHRVKYSVPAGTGTIDKKSSGEFEFCRR